MQQRLLCFKRHLQCLFVGETARHFTNRRDRHHSELRDSQQILEWIGGQHHVRMQRVQLAYVPWPVWQHSRRRSCVSGLINSCDLAAGRHAKPSRRRDLRQMRRKVSVEMKPFRFSSRVPDYDLQGGLTVAPMLAACTTAYSNGMTSSSCRCMTCGNGYIFDAAAQGNCRVCLAHRWLKNHSSCPFD